MGAHRSVRAACGVPARLQARVGGLRQVIHVWRHVIIVIDKTIAAIIASETTCAAAHNSPNEPFCSCRGGQLLLRCQQGTAAGSD